MEFGIVWILFVASIVFLGMFLMRRMGGVRKAQAQARAEYFEKKEKFSTLSSAMFDSIPVEEITHAVLFHIMAKEDKLFEGDSIEDVELFDVLTKGEKLIYTISQVEASMNGGRGSIHSFFIEENYKKYLPYVDETFRSINCFEIAELMKAAGRLAQIIEEDLEDEENDLEGDYASYNFADYTEELLTLLKSLGIIEKAGKYIKDHKELFIDQEEIMEVGSEVNEEGISDEI